MPNKQTSRFDPTLPITMVDNGDGTYSELVSIAGGGGGGSVPTGPAGTPNAAVVSVQGIAGGTALPVQPAFVVEALAASTVKDYSAYGMVELDFRSVTGAISIKRDLTDASTVLTGFYDQNGNGPYSTITAAGVYQIPGGKIQWSAASGTPTCIVRAAQ